MRTYPLVGHAGCRCLDRNGADRLSAGIEKGRCNGNHIRVDTAFGYAISPVTECLKTGFEVPRIGDGVPGEGRQACIKRGFDGVIRANARNIWPEAVA